MLGPETDVPYATSIGEAREAAVAARADDLVQSMHGWLRVGERECCGGATTGILMRFLFVLT